MTEVYRRVKEAMDGELSRLGKGRKRETSVEKRMRDREEERIAKEEETKLKQEEEEEAATEMMRRILEETGAPVRRAGPTEVTVDKRSTPACLLPIGTTESRHCESSDWHYVSMRPKSGGNGKCAPTHGEMSNLKGPLVLCTDSTLAGKVGEYQDNAINQWMRVYTNAHGTFLVSYVTYPGMAMGERRISRR